MSDFLEFEKETKAIKSIILDDFSVEDLRKYINELVNDFFLYGDFYVGKRVWCLLIYGIYESIDD